MSEMSPKCVICGSQPTVRSHLLPRAFIRAIRGNDSYVLLTDRDRPGRRFIQGGTYSDDIFCDEHEGITGRLDGVALAFCRAVYSGSPLRVGTAFSVDSCDSTSLMKFACSILLRCHYSRRDEARLIDLGPYAAILRKVVFDDDRQALPDFYVYAAVSRSIDFRELASMPASRVVDGFRRWSFQGGGVAFVIDLGRPRPENDEFIVRPGSPIKGPVFDFEQTSLASSWRSLIGSS